MERACRCLLARTQAQKTLSASACQHAASASARAVPPHRAAPHRLSVSVTGSKGVMDTRDLTLPHMHTHARTHTQTHTSSPSHRIIGELTPPPPPSPPPNKRHGFYKSK